MKFPCYFLTDTTGGVIPDGYEDNPSFSMTFDDAAASGFHTYRLGVTGGDENPLLSSLTGSFQLSKTGKMMRRARSESTGNHFQLGGACPKPDPRP